MRKIYIILLTVMIIAALSAISGCRQRITADYDSIYDSTTEEFQEEFQMKEMETEPTAEESSEEYTTPPTTIREYDIKMMDNIIEETTQNHTERTTERPTEKPTERPTEAPTGRPTETPTEKPTERPTERPTEAPTEAPTERPAEEYIEKAVADENAPVYINYVAPNDKDKNEREGDNADDVNTENTDSTEETKDNISEAPAVESEIAELSIEITELSDKGEEAVISDDGGAVGTIIDKYTELLSEGFGSLYECQKGYVFLESTEDYRTFNKKSAEHLLITEAGGYNVAEKLNDELLTVDDKWILRKNPTVIVKCVSSDILGSDVRETASAKTLFESIVVRSEWSGISAVINGNVILLSEQLFESDEGRLLAKLYISEIMYPDLFEEMDMSEICRQIKEAGGADFTDGIYLY